MSFGVSIGDIIKVCEIATRVYKNCRDSPGEYRALTGEARSLSNRLQDVADKVESQSIPESKQQQLADTFKNCVDVLSELDKTLKHYNSLNSKSKRAWDRLKWNSETSRILREKLTSTATLLNSFYISLIHDNQVRILEALGRLEQDYQGGHREESLTSVELLTSGTTNEDDDDATCRQIIRDLEDVGISSEIALRYRKFIVDWFVKALNEGRLLEHGLQTDSFGTLAGNMNEALDSASPNSPSLSLTFEDISLTYSPIDTAVGSQPRYPEGLQPPLTQPLSPEILQPPPWGYLGPPLQSNTPTSIFVHTEQHVVYSYVSLHENARRIASAWVKRDYSKAWELLKSQLATVERGETVPVASHHLQPNTRILTHLMGVCASFSGKFQEAKGLFESIVDENNLKKGKLDQGDIAAALWLGDTCLHLNQQLNAALAWAVALDALVKSQGPESDVFHRTQNEFRMLTKYLPGFRRLRGQISGDAMRGTDIFMAMSSSAKAIHMGRDKCKYSKDWNPYSFLMTDSPVLPQTALTLPFEVLLGPLESSRAWPLA